MSRRKRTLSEHLANGAAARRRDEGGFTLIELLVVIIILGILSAVVVFAVRGTNDKGQAAATTTDAKTVRTAEEAFCAKVGRYGDMDELSGVKPVNGQTYKFLSEPSTKTAVQLSGGGPCGTSAASAFALTSSTAEVNIAANADQWVVSDTGSGPAYASSAYVYPLNSNMMEPLVIIGSNYTLKPGLALSWELIETTTNRSPQPAIHSSYTNAPDRPFNQATWRFHLRPGVVFQDGSAFDADDVIWSWRDRQPLNAASLTTVTGTLGFTHKLAGQTPDAFDSVEKIDQYTVDFTPKVANLRLVEQIGHPKGAIVPSTGPAGFANIPGLSIPRQTGKHFDGSTFGLPAATVVFGSSSPPATTRIDGAPVGTGPFQYVSYTPDVSASMKRFEGYWGPKAQIAKMNYKFLPEAPQRTSALTSGQYDFAIDVNPLDVSTVSVGGSHVVTASYGQNALLYVNKVVKDTPAGAAPASPPSPPGTPGGAYRFNLGADLAVRRAVSLAINRTDIKDSIYGGNAAEGRWMAPPNILGASQSIVPALAFDAAGAAAALTGAGWSCPGAVAANGCAGNVARVHATDGGPYSGRTLRLTLIGTPDVSQLGYDLLRSEMASVGITLNAIRANCNAIVAPATACAGVVGGGPSRGQMYNTAYWDLDLEVPNQNDANPAFLPVLRMACLATNGNFRFAPVDGVNATGPAFADTNGNGNGSFPFGNNPCNLATAPVPITTNTAPGSYGPMDVPAAYDGSGNPTTGWVEASNKAGTTAIAQVAAANQMRILVGQNESNVVIPIVGQFRIYGMKSKVNLGDPHPSQTSQRWDSLTVAP